VWPPSQQRGYSGCCWLAFGHEICEAHNCPCGRFVDVLGTLSLSSRHASGRSERHHNLNDVVARASAGVPVQKEPLGLIGLDGKRPDGVTQYRGGTGDT
jgi:hypothetical protein